MTIRVLCFGLGPIGLGIARLAAQRSHLQIVAALDVDPAKIGCDLGDLLGGPPADIIVTGDLAEALACSPDVALHATSSQLSQITPELEALMAAGVRVISTCEELAYPWALQPQIAVNLDRLARTHSVVLLGTGVNPGYVMDTLPLLLSAPCAIVRSVHVTRVVDVAHRRASLQHKVGAGLTPDAFAAKVQAGTIGHVGLQESLNMLAGSFGWQLEKLHMRLRRSLPVMTSPPQLSPSKRGRCLGSTRLSQGACTVKRLCALTCRWLSVRRTPTMRSPSLGIHRCTFASRAAFQAILLQLR